MRAIVVIVTPIIAIEFVNVQQHTYVHTYVHTYTVLEEGAFLFVTRYIAVNYTQKTERAIIIAPYYPDSATSLHSREQ